VTDHLHQGRNAVAVMLAGGWYVHGQWEGMPYGERPKVIVQMNLELADGSRMSLLTDRSWKASKSPITACTLSGGEAYDARLERPGFSVAGHDDSQWESVALASPPGGRLVSQKLPPIKVIKSIRPVRILQPKPDVYVYDFGQHFSGWTRLSVRGPRGTEVTLKYAGKVYDDGRLNRGNNLGAAQTDTYILKGNGEEVWEPRFTLHGFRYVELTGFPGKPTLESLQGRFVRSAVTNDGSFSCSNPLLYRIHSNSRWTLATSFQGIPQDAAERSERVGWMGDPGFVAEDYMVNFGTAVFWTKWLQDIQDAQTPEGEVPIVCPSGSYSMMPAWHSSYPLFVWYMYQYYADERILAEHYEGLAKLIGFFGTHAQDFILHEGLGDHMEPQAGGISHFSPRHTPAALTSTAYYYFDTWILAQAAEVLGKTEDAERYNELAEKIKAAFNREFFDPATNQYATGSQTSNAMALYLRLVPEGRQPAVLKNLVDDILVNHQGHLSTGIIGTNALEQVLPEFGRADVMYTIATQTTAPSP